MKQKQPEEKRAVQLHFLVTPEESRTIHKRMAESGISSLSAYLRKLALNGYIVHLDISGVRELVKLLRICANNLNQYARRAHESGSVYAADVKDLQDRLAAYGRRREAFSPACLKFHKRRDKPYPI